MKKQVILLIVISLAILSLGCADIDIDPNELIPSDTEQPVQETPQETDNEGVTSTISKEKIRIGAFNVQVYGQSKASEEEEVMDILGETIRTYDIVCIQEIRDKSQTSIIDLIQEANSENNNYDYVASERLGRTSSKEQYMYIYNSSTITITGTPHTYPEPDGDVFHREPYIASFKVNGGNYDGVMVCVHTDPDEATEEINQLDEVLEYAMSIYEGEQDFIIMGDFNADGSYFDEDGTSDLDEYAWLIDDSLDTTTKSTDYTYDRIVITDTSDYTGNAGVFRYDLEYGLNQDLTEDVSDHYPVYAEFWTNRDDDLNATVEITQTSTDNSSSTPSDSNSSAIMITDLSLDEEWIEITNNGENDASLEGWYIIDEANHKFTFPVYTLQAGKSVTVYTAGGTDTDGELYWGRSNVWNNDGDIATLYNADKELVDKYEK